MKIRKAQYSADICELSHKAALDGLDSQDLVDVLLAAATGVLKASNLSERDIAEIYWELSRYHDAIADTCVGQHATALRYASVGDERPAPQ